MRPVLPRSGLRAAVAAGAAALLFLCGCAASPLWVEGGQRTWSGAEVPRDGRGEPIFELIRPAPSGARASPGGAAAGRAPAPAASRAAVCQPAGEGDILPEAAVLPGPRQGRGAPR